MDERRNCKGSSKYSETKSERWLLQKQCQGKTVALDAYI